MMVYYHQIEHFILYLIACEDGEHSLDCARGEGDSDIKLGDGGSGACEGGNHGIWLGGLRRRS